MMAAFAAVLRKSMLLLAAVPGAAAADDKPALRYYEALRAAVQMQWLRPESAAPGLKCTVEIVQAPRGDVVSAKIVEPCDTDAPTRASIERAVRRASPLPYAGYEEVFERTLRLVFTYNG